MWRSAPRLLEETPPPPSSTPRRSELPLQGKCEGKKLGEFLGRGGTLPPRLPLQHPLEASGKIWQKFVLNKIIWRGMTPLPPPPLQHPLAACGRSGRFGACEDNVSWLL